MKKILLIEDDPFLVDIYTTKLKEAGFEVETAGDGKIGLGKLKKKKPDLALLDIVLPYVTGWELLEKIRKDEKLKDLKVIILSNLYQEREVKKGLELGIMAYLIKANYTPAQVVEEIEKILK